MNTATRQALNALNHRFYLHFSRRFDATREHPWPGWLRLLAGCEQQIPGALERPLAILDVGCGNGRFATFAMDRLPCPPRYLGLDGSLPLLASARRRTHFSLNLRWAAARLGDDLQGGAPGLPLRASVNQSAFDLVVCLAVLHHLPGHQQRAGFVRSMAERLRPGGLLALSIWCFDQQRGFERKHLPWEEFRELQRSRGEELLDLDELEPGDHLLTWDGNRTIPRYCHLPDTAEIEGWKGSLQLVDRFRADGTSGEDNLYLILKRTT